MSGADEDGVDGVASGAGETVAFEQAVGFGMADDRLDRGPSAQLAFDGRRAFARALREVDFGRRKPVAAIAFVDVEQTIVTAALVAKSSAELRTRLAGKLARKPCVVSSPVPRVRHDTHDLAQRLSYSSWRCHQTPVSLRPFGADLRL